MKYTKTNKLQPKLPQSNNLPLIPTEFIVQKRFDEIINIFNTKVENVTELKQADRYLYGYSLLRTQQKVKALVVLWPLIKHYATLQNDCAVIATDIFKESGCAFMEHLSEDELNVLFSVVKTIQPQSIAYSKVKKYLFEFLWQNAEYEKLERNLKSNKDSVSNYYIENLSKLAFFQAEKKLMGNPQAFVSLVLTGGACLIQRNPMYHNDIEEEITLLVCEIKNKYYQLKNKVKLVIDPYIFEKFIDNESKILIQVLQQAVTFNVNEFNIIPTPHYFIYNLSMNEDFSNKFIPWLASVDTELHSMYSVATYRASMWAIGTDKATDIKVILQQLHQNKFNPYLQLALMFRIISTKKALVSDMVKLSDFSNMDKTSRVFKNIALQTIKQILSNNAKMPLSPEFYKMLSMFSSVLNSPEICTILMSQEIKQLFQELKDREGLNIERALNVAKELNATDFIEQLDEMFICKHECRQFLAILNDVKATKKIIKELTDKEKLLKHLTLIANCCYLCSNEELDNLFDYFTTLVNSRKINKILSLQKLFERDFDCNCEDCQNDFYEFEIPEMAEELKLPVVCLATDKSLNSEMQGNTATTVVHTPSLLLQDNPFKMLNVSCLDSKPVIMQQLMKLIQCSPEQMAKLRNAQSELFDPKKRFLHHYLRFLSDDEIKNDDMQDSSNLIENNIKLNKIPFRRELLPVNQSA